MFMVYLYLHVVGVLVSLEIFAHSYDIKYSYLMQIICTQLCGFKHSYIILMICMILSNQFLFNNEHLFAHSYMVSSNSSNLIIMIISLYGFMVSSVSI